MTSALRYAATLPVQALLLDDAAFDVEQFARARLTALLWERHGAVADSFTSHRATEEYELPRRWWERLLRRPPRTAVVDLVMYRATGMGPAR